MVLSACSSPPRVMCIDNIYMCSWCSGVNREGQNENQIDLKPCRSFVVFHPKFHSLVWRSYLLLVWRRHHFIPGWSHSKRALLILSSHFSLALFAMLNSVPHPIVEGVILWWVSSTCYRESNGDEDKDEEVGILFHNPSKAAWFVHFGVILITPNFVNFSNMCPSKVSTSFHATQKQSRKYGC